LDDAQPNANLAKLNPAFSVVIIIEPGTKLQSN
jgi:hypothetical protein